MLISLFNHYVNLKFFRKISKHHFQGGRYQIPIKHVWGWESKIGWQLLNNINSRGLPNFSEVRLRGDRLKLVDNK